MGKLAPKSWIKALAIKKLFKDNNSPAYWYKHNDVARITAFFGSMEAYEKQPTKWEDFKLWDYKKQQSNKPNRRSIMRTLIILSAIPASGKSTWAAQYQATHKNVYIVSSDAIRMEITGGNYQDHTKQKQVWELFSKRIHEYGAIDGSTVIL